ncbi:probable serine/threonine-protein kinase clkA [Chenopodium quinoa]|uniref:probable serine/threonine-protein kinase clkA n=1 Tax=Chenopodium quinoa TaxID=63459 RepID=UPI000B77206C|nr:probable serine/threonine-protein kinase clkA [Chenopodium quinoa]
MAGGSGNNNDGGELSEVMRQLAVVAQQLARNSTNNIDAQGELFKKMAQSKPPTYQGEPNPTILENYKMKLPLRHYWIQLDYVSGEEKSKARKFESGLTTDLQLKLCGQVFETLDEVYGRAAHLYALKLNKKKELVEIEGKEKRKEVGQNSRNRQSNQNNFKKQKYHHNNNFSNNNNFQGNNRHRGRNFNGGAKNSTQGNNRGARHFYYKRCKNDHPGRDCDGNLVTCRACNKLGHKEYECFSKDPNRKKQGNNQGGAQKNFQGNNNYSGNKGAQQNAAKTNNNNGNNQ